MEFMRHALQSLANCCLNCREETTRAGEPDERTSLLIEQHRRNVNNIVPPPHLEDDINEYASSLPKRDEQTALNRIVQETNSNIIDVSADTHLLEQSEYNDRIKLYTQRLSHQWHQVQVNDTKYNGLLHDVPNPEVHLAFSQNADDIAMIKNFVKEAAQAVNDMKIDNNDELVVPFLIT